MRSTTQKWIGGVSAAAIVAMLGYSSSAAALVITGGPVYSLPGGGSCTVANVTTTGTGATVSCTGVNLAAHTRVYFGIKNNTIINGASTNGSGITGGELFTTFNSAGASNIAYTSTSAMVSDCASGTCSTANGAVPQTLNITRTAGTATVVATGGIPASNGNGAIERLFRLDSGSAFTFDIDITGISGAFSGQLCGVYDAAHSTSGSGGCASRVDLAFYYSDCGDGIVDSPEQCDLAGQNGASTSCCTSTCTFRAGGATCRGASGVCDAIETCTGSSGTCPADVFSNSSTLCRAGSGDSCDVNEFCPGNSSACPADDAPGNFGDVCNAGSGDLCDPNETCTGVPGQSCPADNVTSAGTLCRAGSGDACDTDETCTGVANQACPADDAPGNSGNICRTGSGDSCDVDEACTGTPGQTCPADDAPGNAGNVCNPGSGDSCDPDETCSGTPGQVCPSDTVTPGGTLCRAGSGDACDTDESCTGTADQACPADDAITNAGNVCRTGSGDSCDVDETCTGTPGQTCPADDAPGNAGNVCNAGTGDLCDPDETCSGTPGQTCPSDTVTAGGTLCRAGSGDACDTDESCTGVADQACPTDDAPGNAGNLCRAGSGDSCDPDETCTGTPGATCPADTVSSVGTVCRAGSGDACDIDETCSGNTGEACPADDVAGNAGNICRTGSGDSCDVDESCTGTPGQACPADDAPGNAGNVCNLGSGDICDPDETCTGTPGATCPGDTVSPDTTVCRVAVDDCDAAEECSGIANQSCPADGFQPAGTDCPNSNLCDGDETCDGNGACVGGPTPACDDDSACTVDSCDGLLGCINDPMVQTGCIDTFLKGSLVVNEKNALKEKVTAKFSKGPALSQTDFGNPLSAGGTAYDMCIFDASGNLAGSFHVDRAGDLCDGKPCWKKIGQLPPTGKGYNYKDKLMTSDGVKGLQVKGGDAGKSKASVKAQNRTGQMPTGIAAALQAGVPAGSAATVQLIPNGEPGGLPAGTVCLTMELADVKKNDGIQFKAKIQQP